MEQRRERRFKVFLRRIITQDIEVEVVADNDLEAGEKALEGSPDWNAGNTDAVEQVERADEICS